jgi:hypothetical protein
MKEIYRGVFVQLRSVKLESFKVVGASFLGRMVKDGIAELGSTELKNRLATSLFRSALRAYEVNST